jgi:hypothetical protein
VLVMLLVLVAGPKALPDPKDCDPDRLDPASVVLALAAILPFIYGIKELAKAGWDAVPATALLAGAAFGVVFVARQRRLASPLLDVRLFANRTVRGALLVALSVAAIPGRNRALPHPAHADGQRPQPAGDGPVDAGPDHRAGVRDLRQPGRRPIGLPGVRPDWDSLNPGAVPIRTLSVLLACESCSLGRCWPRRPRAGPCGD